MNQEIYKLLANNTLEILDLSSNSLDEEECDLIGSSLSKNYSLTTLNLTNCQLTYEALRKIIRGLMSHPTLKTLIVSKNNIGDQGMIILGSFLFGNRSLSDLNINDCSVTKHGFTEFLISLLNNKYLTNINISGNPIEGLEEIKEKTLSIGSITFQLN